MATASKHGPRPKTLFEHEFETAVPGDLRVEMKVERYEDGGGSVIRFDEGNGQQLMAHIGRPLAAATSGAQQKEAP